MTKWFYRAVGTVGIAGGFLLLAGGAAQADDAPVNDLRGSLDGFLTPLGPDAFGSSGPFGADHRGDDARMVGGDLGGLGDVDGFLGAAPTRPAAGLKTSTPAGGAAAERPATLSTLPVVGTFTDVVGAEALTRAVPLTGDTTGLNGLGSNATSLGGLVPSLSAIQHTKIGPAVPASLGVVPVDAVQSLDPDRLVSGQSLDAGRLLPAVIGDQMTAQQPELFSGESLATLPVIGDLSLTGLPAPGGAAPVTPATTAPAAPGLGGGALGGLPLLGGLTGGAPTTLPAPAAKPAVAPKKTQPSISPTADDTRAAGRHRAMSHSATERPIAGEDTDFTESTRVEALEMPALNLPLPVVGNLGNLGGLLGGGAAPADPATAPAPSDKGFDPNGGPVSRMDV